MHNAPKSDVLITGPTRLTLFLCHSCMQLCEPMLYQLTSVADMWCISFTWPKEISTIHIEICSEGGYCMVYMRNFFVCIQAFGYGLAAFGNGVLCLRAVG